MHITKYIAIGFIIAVAVGALVSRDAPNLQTMADEVNRTLKAPVMLDRDTRFEGASVSGNNLLYLYTLVNYHQGTLDADRATALEFAARADLCNSIQARREAYAKAGVKFISQTNNSAGVTLSTQTVDPARCH